MAEQLPVIEPLRTPEEVSDMLVHISPFTIRRLVQQRAIPYTKGERGKVLFSRANIDSLINHLAVPAGEAREPEYEDDTELFGSTSRSSARGRKAS